MDFGDNPPTWTLLAVIILSTLLRRFFYDDLVVFTGLSILAFSNHILFSIRLWRFIFRNIKE